MERNNLYSDEVYEKVNKESKLVLEDYILELKAKGRAVKTIEQYVFDIRMYLCYVYDNIDNKSILELKRRDFRNFFLYLSETGKSPARINRVQSSIRNLLQFAEDDEDDWGDYESNPMRKIKSIEKAPVREIVFLTDEQITFLINYLLEKGKTQKALYVSLSFDSTARRNEVIQVEKYSFMDESLSKTNVVQGKRSKMFALMYSNRTKEIAKKWLEERGEDDIDSLWVSYYNGEARPLRYETLYAWVVSFRSILEAKYDEDLPIFPHVFRHSAAECYTDGTHYALSEMGRDKLEISELKILMRHENIDITNSYLKNKDDEILESLFK